jgi:hypothetical protein
MAPALKLFYPAVFPEARRLPRIDVENKQPENQARK